MRQKEPATKLIFIRHGQTDFPTDRIYCDNIEDPALNQQGQQQAQQAAKLLHGQPIEAIYASPAKRTLTTAQTLASTLDLPIHERPALRERVFGIWEGLYFHEIESAYPDEYRQWKTDKSGFKPEGGESIHDLSSRLQAELQNIINTHAGKTIAIVSHVGPIRAAVAHAMSMPTEMYRQLRIDYASLSRVDYGKSQNNLIYMNFSAQLVG